MRKLLMILSFIGLGLTVIPSFFVLSGRVEWALHSKLMLTGMIIWFVCASIWMNRKKQGENN